MSKLVEHLEKLAQSLQDVNNEVFILAQDESDEVLAVIAKTMINCSLMVKKSAEDLKFNKKSFTIEDLREIAVLASEFDKSDDPWLQKQASVLDEILRTIGSPAARAAKEAARELETSAQEDAATNPYTKVKLVQDKENKVEEARKAMADKVKAYRPLEAPLMTRTCPDHPGAQMTRVAEYVYQCSMDKGIYDYQAGYTTMRGDKVPGTDLANQTVGLNDRPNEFTSFDSRESRLNQKY